jgi:NADPH-dependent curcumin reductase CurA
MDLTQVRMTEFYDGTTDKIFETTHDELPELEDGQVKLRTETISVDPAMRGWTTNTRSYIPPVQPGEVMRCFGVGEVLESKSDKLKPGDWVTGLIGVQNFAVMEAKRLTKIELTNHAQAHDYLSGLGMTGQTAYFGMVDIGEPKEGETVLVSAAGGAVGSIACQIAKLKGARVIGIAGGPEKCAYLKDELKLNGTIDYKSEKLSDGIQRECPDGIDVFFDNVGGETLEAAMARMNKYGRLVICGAISQYGDIKGATGPRGFLSVIGQSLKIQGFTIMNYPDRIPEAFKYLLEAKMAGKLTYREHVIDGIENFENALAMLFKGENKGKLLVKVAK